MIRINLLPHREEARKQRRTQFYTLLGLVALLGGVVWFVGHTLIGQRIDAQESSNDFVKREIAVLDKEIAEIKRLQEQTQALLSRKQVIESLQSNRAETVHVFNELGKQVPEGVFIRSVRQTGARINLLGYAQSNARVSQLMRNLDASPIFEKPELVEIKAADFNRRRVGDFNLFVSIEKASVDQSEPSAADNKEQKK
jgi:type IV pilus assembly protein PilN